MTDKQEVHSNNQWEQIEVLGLLDVRKIAPERLSNGHTRPNRFIKDLDNPPIKHYINRKESPVRNICEDFTTREEAIKMFDKLLWDSWNACDAMEESAREWFAERVKEYQKGCLIDLICDCRRFRGNDAQVGLGSSAHPSDCHGYTLKKYIEFLAQKSNK
ncbi:hypothetical protein [Prochlorococcus sp. MIT 1223]|uniref:hypothetical protein n=1 Tax=Prochlorococcus sp. MIT 1223 TaxID=3096217 RepID=UPI002A76323F|nr:hypothetical protein [Prochlorococcus sp. MIT 1223]